jgi:hypothetical protein
VQSLPVGSSWHPSLSTDQVTASSPGDGVLTAWSVGVGSLGSVVGPPGEVESVVGTGSGWGSTTLGELGRLTAGELAGWSRWGSDGSGEDGGKEGERGELDHFEEVVRGEELLELESEGIDWRLL